MCPAKVLLCKIPILDRCLWTGFLNMTPDRRRTLTHLNLLMSADLIFFLGLSHLWASMWS